MTARLGERRQVQELRSFKGKLGGKEGDGGRAGNEDSEQAS